MDNNKPKGVQFVTLSSYDGYKIHPPAVNYYIIIFKCQSYMIYNNEQTCIHIFLGLENASCIVVHFRLYMYTFPLLFKQGCSICTHITSITQSVSSINCICPRHFLLRIEWTCCWDSFSYICDACCVGLEIHISHSQASQDWKALDFLSCCISGTFSFFLWRGSLSIGAFRFVD